MRRVRPETYNRLDNCLYDEESGSWWRPDSSFYQLKVAFNPVRVGYVRRKLFGEFRLDPRGKKALEVGCGGGFICEEVARMGFDVTGVDPSEPSLQVAIHHARASGLDVHYERAAGESLPFCEESYDVVLCCDVLEHVRDLSQVIAEVSRVLKPGGLFFYDTLNRTWLSKLVAIKLAQEWKRWAFVPPRLHVWDMFITPGEMKSLLRQNQLEWKDHRGMKPGVALVSALATLRQRARGDCTYAALGERLKLVESRVTAVMYLGYAVKRRARIGDRSSTEERDV